MSDKASGLPITLRWLTGAAAIGSAFLAMDSLRLFSERPLLDFIITVQNHYYYALMGLLLPLCYLLNPTIKNPMINTDANTIKAAFGIVLMNLVVCTKNDMVSLH